jgi:glycerophosphoryl diester phosphodiesterase
MAGFVLAGFILFVTLNNTSLLAPEPSGDGPILLAHRGVHQDFTTEVLTNDSCTAQMIYPPEHPFLENTLPSIAESFRLGADIVEFDIHPTTDGQFAVLHDWTVDCRTDGTGVTRELSMAYLKALDIGHGYTPDGGKTFPFRGKFIGMMPTLDEVLAAFPDRRFLINFKSNSTREGELLAERLMQLPPERRRLLMVYGGRGGPTGTMRERLPEIRAMDGPQLLSCVWRYEAIGWSGYVPRDCRNTMIYVPENLQWLIWGWPNRFLARMRAANSEVIVYPGIGTGARGIDTIEQFEALPQDYRGGLWTNRIERIGPLARN